MSSARELIDVVVSILRSRGLAIPAPAVGIEPSPLASSCRIYTVDVGGHGHGLPPLLLKDLSPAQRLPEAIGMRPSRMYHPLREIAIYRHVLSPQGVGPTYFGAYVDRYRNRSLLLLERVDAVPLDFVGELATWCRAARAIGEIHRRLADVALPRNALRHLFMVDGAELGFWIDRLAHSRFDHRGRVDAITRSRDRLCAEFDALPRIVAHGELYASNVLVDDDRTLPIDWELASFAPGAIDIAALSSGDWDESARGALVDAYRDGLGRQRRDASDRAIELARLYLALRLATWAENWSPPADERRDWIAEAVGAFERLRR